MGTTSFAGRTILCALPETINGDKRLTARAVIHRLGGNEWPHFSITGETANMGGCLHDLIVAYVPEFAPFIRWHLCAAPSGQPMHYVANAEYWRDMAKGLISPSQYQREEPQAILPRHILLGVVLETDTGVTVDDILTWTRPEFREWLELRSPGLRREFLADMAKLFGEDAAKIGAIQSARGA